MTRLLTLVCTVVLLPASVVHAAPIGAGQTSFPVVAIQSLRLLPNTFLNPSGSAIELGDVSAPSPFAFDRAAQVGSEISLTNGTFFGTGEIPGLGPFELFTVTPATMQISNVVQDTNDPGFASGDPSSFQSGDGVLNLVDYGARVAGIDLTVKDPFLFRVDLDGLPPSVGTLFVSDPFAEPDGILDIFATDPNTQQEVIVAQTFNRRLVTIPEPAAATLLVAMMAGGIGLGRRAPLRPRW